MAFATRRFVKHIDKYDVTHRLEIQEDGFGGSESAIHTMGQVFTFEHETHASEDEEILNVYENPVQKGSIELFLRIDNSTDRTLITDIFNGDEDDFRLVWKIDGTIFWTGTILNDMLEYPESDYPYMAKLWAKDFSRLEGIDYTLDDTRQTLITTFADLISNLGYSLDIETHTSWTNSATTDTTDFLQQIYHETKALREFARTGDESDETINVLEALQMMCRNFGCVLRQEGGVFKIIQYSEYETPTAVNVTVYDSTGTQKTAATSTDLSLDASTNDITITDRSLTKAFKGIKKAKNTFNHRTKVGGIQFEDNFELDSGTPTKSYSQFFLSDGNQQVEIEGLVEGYFASGHDDVTADIRIKIIRSGLADYFWDGSSWTTTGSTISVALTNTGRSSGLGVLHLGGFRELTNATPSDADGTLEVTFLRADSAASGFATTTIYRNATFDILNEVASENSLSIDYILTQIGQFSSIFEFPDTWYGDGPTAYAVSALRHGSADADFTVDTWQRRGTTTGYRNFHENLLKEIIDLQRSNRVKTESVTLGADYDTEKILTYRSKSLAYTGGQFIGKEGDWQPVLFEINVVTGTDTFEDLPKFTDEGTGTGSSGGGSGGGLDQSTADARYFKQASLLSEASDLPTLRSNIGLSIGSDVQAWDAQLDDVAGLTPSDGNVIIGDGTNFITESGNTFRTSIGLGTDDSPTFAGGTFNGTVTIENNNPTLALVESDASQTWHIDSSGGSIRFENVGGGIPYVFTTNGDLTMLGDLSAVGGTFSGAVDVNAHLSANTGSFGTDTLTSGSVLTVGGDMDVQGLLDAETIQTQTLRTTLFKPTTISGMGGEIAFSAVSTVVSIDTGANTIVVEDAVFANGDSVVVSSAIFNQSGFSNVELNITSAGSAVTGGTEYSYTVNSGVDTDIDTGDSVTRVNGDLVYINATKGSGSPRIAGFDGLSGFADSPLSGDTATAVWELNPQGGKIGGFAIDLTTMESLSSAGGIKLDASNKEFVFYEDNGTTDRLELNIDNEFTDPGTLTTVTATSGGGPTGFPVAAGGTGTIEPGAIGQDGAAIEAIIEISGSSNNSGDSVSGTVTLQFHDGTSWTTVDTGYYDTIGVTQISITLAALFTGYSDVRVQVDNDATSDDSMAYDDSTFNEVVGKTEINLLGMQVAVTSSIYSRFGGGTAEIGGNLTITEDLFVEGDAFKTGGGSWSVLSDGSLKDDLGTVNEGIDYLMSLGESRWFIYNEKSGMNSNKRFAGFDAREAGVAKTRMRFKGSTYDGFDWNTHQAILHNAILEQQKRIEELEEKIKSQ